jgi:hypothetical protein
MKYVAAIVIIILFARIDVLLEFFDKTSEKLSGESVEVDVTNTEISREVIPINEDINLKRSPKENFFILMEDFHRAPTAETREKAIALLKANPGILSDKLDQKLESRVFSWRDLLINNNQETVNFILDLMKILKGENFEMMNRFFAIWMDINMEHFIAAYVRTKDLNCSIAVTFGDQIPEEEKLNDFYDREEALKKIVEKPNIDPVQKSLASNCLLQIGLQIAKITPPKQFTSPVESVPNEATEAAP